MAKKTAIIRNGTACAVLQDGHPRRMADGRNAYRKMGREQREAFLAWAHDEDPETWRRTVEQVHDSRAWVTR